MQLPDAEALCADLARQLRAHVTPETGMVGIHTGGAWLAERLHRALALALPLGTLDISFYRDDYRTTGLHKSVRASRIPFDVGGRHLLLVDDVLYTGRTVRAALNEIFDYGRPASVKLAVLVDRGGRQLPVEADIAAARLQLAPGQSLALARADDGSFSFRLKPSK